MVKDDIFTKVFNALSPAEQDLWVRIYTFEYRHFRANKGMDHTDPCEQARLWAKTQAELALRDLQERCKMEPNG